jgi:hypothetical protein
LDCAGKTVDFYMSTSRDVDVAKWSFVRGAVSTNDRLSFLEIHGSHDSEFGTPAGHRFDRRPRGMEDKSAALG